MSTQEANAVYDVVTDDVTSLTLTEKEVALVGDALVVFADIVAMGIIEEPPENVFDIFVSLTDKVTPFCTEYMDRADAVEVRNLNDE